MPFLHLDAAYTRRTVLIFACHAAAQQKRRGVCSDAMLSLMARLIVLCCLRAILIGLTPA